MQFDYAKSITTNAFFSLLFVQLPVNIESRHRFFYIKPITLVSIKPRSDWMGICAAVREAQGKIVCFDFIRFSRLFCCSYSFWSSLTMARHTHSSILMNDCKGIQFFLFLYFSSKFSFLFFICACVKFPFLFMPQNQQFRNSFFFKSDNEIKYLKRNEKWNLLLFSLQSI